jgi:hypothetical protein
MIVSENDKKREIFICTTFRDFNGTENDEIQKLFLESLKNQTYQNFELVVTIFKEKNVENKIKEFNLPVKFYYDSSQDYKYSHTEVLLNCIKEADNMLFNAIIVWTTADVIFENNFFEIINNYLSQNGVAIIHPHYIYRNINDFIKNSNSILTLRSGMDVIVFDGSLFYNKNILEDIKKYKNVNWGLFEHFLCALGFLYAKKRINLFYKTKVKKIINNLSILQESMPIADPRNIDSFKKFLKEKHLSYDFFYLFKCNKIFDIYDGNKLKYYWELKNYFFTKDFLFSLIPKRLKFLLKDLFFKNK